jgi:hypothetical protein
MIWLNRNKFFKKYLPLILSVILVVVGLSSYFLIQNSKPAEASWFSSSQGTWNYRQKIVINHKQINTATGTTTPLSNFPVEISVPANALTKSINNGGHVGLDTGYDIVFTSGDGKTKYAHEIESYASTTGAIIAWVKIPSLSSKTDTTIYMYYGNASETGNEQNATAVWDANYKGVWHLPNGTILSGADSTGQNNATNLNSVSVGTGQIDGAASFSGTATQHIDLTTNASIKPTLPITIEAWVKTSDTTNTKSIFSNENGSGNYYGVWVSKSTANLLAVSYGDGTGAIPNSRRSKVGTSTFGTGWRYVVATIRGATDMSLYLNGTDDGGSYSGTGGALAYSSGVGRIGDNGATQNWNGTIDEVRISNISRSADWIKTEYNNQSSLSTFETFGAEETQQAAQINGGWYNAGWSYRKKITIPHSQVSGTSTLSNFPVLISTTQQILSYTSFGGHTASSTGGDILFTASDGKTPLNYEIESYASTTGQLIAWVQIPSLSPTSDNTIYMYYGNASAPTVPATTAQNVWSNGYAGVWHLPNGTTLTANDSILNGNNGTLSGSPLPTAITGQIDGAASFDGSHNYVDLGSSKTYIDSATPFTISFWMNLNAYSNNEGILSLKTSGTNAFEMFVYTGATYGPLSFGSSDGTFVRLHPSVDFGSSLVSAWNFVTLTYNGSGAGTASNYSLSVNNNSKTLNTSSTFFGIGNVNDIAKLGTGTYYLNGSMDEVHISTSARTPSWIATEYANQSLPSTFETIAGEETQAVTTFNSTWYSSAWGYRKPIVIDHRKINKATNTTTPLTNFPVLVSITDTDLKNYASTTGADILFTASDGKTKLNHEIESYNSATGQLIAWVSVPSLSNVSDTVLYMYFGNATATSQQNASGTWNDGNFQGVYHLPNGTSLTANNSVSGGLGNGSNTAATAVTGQIDGSADFVAANSAQIDFSNPDLSSYTAFTASVWMKASSVVGTIFGQYSTAANMSFLLDQNGGSCHAQSRIRTNSGIASYQALGTTSLCDGNWHYLSVTWASNTELLYVDGTQQGTHSTTGSYLANASSYSHLWLGRNNGGSYYTGSVDEARISSTARTADWIKTEYLNQSSPSTFYAKGALQTQNHTAQQSNEQITNRGWYNNKALGAWNYRMPVTISHNMVGSSTTATLSNFPVLVSVTNANLKSVSNGGGVASTSAADIVFTDSDGGTKLAHEIESYDAVNGTLIAWVKVPILSTTIDHTIYIYYGNSTANLPSQQNASAVWDSNYKGVWHLPNGTSLSGTDSTGVNNLTVSNATASSTGQIDGAAGFNGTSNYLNTASTLNLTGVSTITVEFWLNKPSFANDDKMAMEDSAIIGGNVSSFAIDTNNNTLAGCGAGTVAFAIHNPTSYNGAKFSRPSAGVLHHYVFVMTGSGATGFSAYVDGNSQQLTTCTDSGSGTFGNYTLYFMSRAGTGLFTAGVMDEVRISNSARTADWITTEYLNQSAPGSYVTLGAQQTSGTAVATTNWYNASWTNRRTITIDHRKVSTVSGTSLTNFPMLFSTTDNEFKMPSGKVKENHGYDFVFTDSDGKTILNSEIETYASSTGQLIAWVKIPNLSSSQDKVIYLYYGNASASAPSSAFTQGVWDSSYKGVWHLGAGPSGSDSTSNGNVGTMTGLTAGTGKIDGDVNNFSNVTNHYMPITNNSGLNGLGSGDWTAEAWVNPTAVANYMGVIVFDGEGIAIGSVSSVLKWTILHTSGTIADSATTAATGQWVHLVATKSGTTYTIYVNGNSNNGTYASQAGWGLSGVYAIGRGFSATYLTGSADEGRISSTARTADWIKTEYLNQLSPGKFYSFGTSNTPTKAANTPVMKLRGNSGIQFR